VRPERNRIPHRLRNLVGLGRKRLDDEKRVSAGPPIQLVPVDAVWLREFGDGRRRERRELDPLDRVARRQLADHDPKRVGAGELVVAISRDHKDRHGLHSPREQPQHIERRLVAPVHVLEHEDGRPLSR
jgi:hypothetical protein